MYSSLFSSPYSSSERDVRLTCQRRLGTVFRGSDAPDSDSDCDGFEAHGMSQRMTNSSRARSSTPSRRGDRAHFDEWQVGWIMMLALMAVVLLNATAGVLVGSRSHLTRKSQRLQNTAGRGPPTLQSDVDKMEELQDLLSSIMEESFGEFIDDAVDRRIQEGTTAHMDRVARKASHDGVQRLEGADVRGSRALECSFPSTFVR